MESKEVLHFVPTGKLSSVLSTLKLTDSTGCWDGHAQRGWRPVSGQS